MPEAYRQQFRVSQKSDKQTHMEFARDFVTHFNWWCTALEVGTFDDLCNLIVLGQFKNYLPNSVATYINERKVKTAADGDALADEYILRHTDDFEVCAFNDGVKVFS